MSETWLSKKEKFITEVREYTSAISTLNPPPMETIDQLLDTLAWVETANQTEFEAEGYWEWWQEQKSSW